MPRQLTNETAQKFEVEIEGWFCIEWEDRIRKWYDINIRRDGKKVDRALMVRELVKDILGGVTKELKDGVPEMEMAALGVRRVRPRK